MAKIDVREAEAGERMDAACAAVNGWIVYHYRSRGTWMHRKDDPKYHRDLPSYSTDIAAAWELVKAIKDDWHPAIDCFYGAWGATMHDGETWGDCTKASGETAPLAIARAFLLAHGVEEIEIGE